MLCALTGHRELPPDFDGEALAERLKMLVAGGCDGFLCGMAAGFDLLALGILADIKRERPIYLEACIPYRGHEARFHQKEREIYRRLLPCCDRQTVLFDGYRNGCFLARDRYMVDCADIVLAYLVRQCGGTAYTVNYAIRKGVTVLYL